MLSKRAYKLLNTFTGSYADPPHNRMRDVEQLVMQGFLEADNGVVSPYTGPGDPNILHRYRITEAGREALVNWRKDRRSAFWVRRRERISDFVVGFLSGFASSVAAYFIIRFISK